MRNTLLTATSFPGIIFGICFILNLFLAAKGSSGAFPATTMLALFALWSCISIPLCYLGSRFAYSKDVCYPVVLILISSLPKFRRSLI